MQVVGASVDSHFSHLAWTQTPRNKGGVGGISFPMLSDLTKQVCARAAAWLLPLLCSIEAGRGFGWHLHAALENWTGA